jgi:hypothetical protein
MQNSFLNSGSPGQRISGYPIYLRVFSLAHTLYDTLYDTSVKICRSNTRQLALTLEALQRTAHSNALANQNLVVDFKVDIESALNYFLERPLRVPTC